MLGIPGLLGRVFHVSQLEQRCLPYCSGLLLPPREAGSVPEPLGNAVPRISSLEGMERVRVGLCTPGRTRPGRFVPGLTVPAPAPLSPPLPAQGPGAKSHAAAGISQLLPAKCGRDLAGPHGPAGAVLQSPLSIPWLL